MKKIYMVVDFEIAYYEGERDSTKLLGVSDDLDKLLPSVKHSPGAQVLAIEEKAFNTNLQLLLSCDHLPNEEGVQVLGYVAHLLQEKAATQDNARGKKPR